MDLETGMRARLLASPGVTGLVDTRIYPKRLPQGAPLPAIVYERISRMAENFHGGPPSLIHPRVQVTSFAGTYDGAKALARATRLALDGYSGPLGASNQIPSATILLIEEIDHLEPETQDFMRTQDYEIWGPEDYD
jgi:hypothetical protein